MKILHISTLDGHTGAGIAAARIHEGLLDKGVESRFCVAHPAGRLKNAFTPGVSFPGRILRSLENGVNSRLVEHARGDDDYVLSTGLVGLDIGRVVEAERPDIVQLHWIAGNSFRLASLRGVAAPIVWRLSDMWSFCGLQHLEPDPAKYTAPPPSTVDIARPWSNLSEHVRLRKQAVYRAIPSLTLACPSRWMLAEARSSALLGDRPAELIPTSCDTKLFSPKDRSACRAVLGLADDVGIVLVGATSMGTRWKGLDLFVEAMAQVGPAVGGRQIRIVTFGHDAFEAPSLEGRVAIQHMGPVRDRRLMSILYSAADVYVAPSRMENLSNAVLEALACGTPAIAFDIGGMPDMIDHRINGFLAKPYDAAELADGIGWALGQGDGLRAAARGKVLASFSLHQEIDRYIALYQGLLAAKRPRG